MKSTGFVWTGGAGNFAKVRGAGVVDGGIGSPRPPRPGADGNGSGWKREEDGRWPRSRMILLLPLIALVATAAAGVRPRSRPRAGRRRPRRAAGRAAQPHARAQPVHDPAKMKWLLKAWEEQSAKLKTLDVQIYRVDKDFSGRTRTTSRAGPSSRAPTWPTWTSGSQAGARRQGAAGPVEGPQEPEAGSRRIPRRSSAARNAVWQYLYDGRQIFIFPLAKGERQRALDEGPLPFLFNMKAEEAEARYQMFFEKENEKHYTVKVLPKVQEDRESFKMAFSTWRRRTCCRPDRAALAGRQEQPGILPGQEQPNAKVDDKIFQGGVYKGWTVQKNPAADGPRRGTPGAVRRGGRDDPPVSRPRPDGGAGGDPARQDVGKGPRLPPVRGGGEERSPSPRARGRGVWGPRRPWRVSLTCAGTLSPPAEGGGCPGAARTGGAVAVA